MCCEETNFILCHRTTHFGKLKPTFFKINVLYKADRGPSSVVGIATDYWLDGPGIESRWERDFPHLSRLALEPTQTPEQGVPGLSRG